MIQTKFYERFNALIDEHGTRISWISKKIRVNTQTVWRWRSGETLPSVENLILLAEIFHTTTDYLLGLSGERNRIMKTKYHMCVNIRGALRNARDFVGNITVDGRTLSTVKEVKDFLNNQLAMGRECLPCGDCDNFDYHKGCLGHKVEDNEC